MQAETVNLVVQGKAKHYSVFKTTVGSWSVKVGALLWTTIGFFIGNVQSICPIKLSLLSHVLKWVGKII